MKKLMEFTNDKERVCDKGECQSIIKIGDKAVVQYRIIGGNKYYHKGCAPK